jgi:hypothetical protein
LSEEWTTQIEQGDLKLNESEEELLQTHFNFEEKELSSVNNQSDLSIDSFKSDSDKDQESFINEKELIIEDGMIETFNTSPVKA